MNLNKNKIKDRSEIKSLSIKNALKELEYLYVKIDKENPYYFIKITTQQICEAVGLSSVPVRKHLQLLNTKNYIDLQPAGRNGYRLRILPKGVNLMKKLCPKPTFSLPPMPINNERLTPSESTIKDSQEIPKDPDIVVIPDKKEQIPQKINKDESVSIYDSSVSDISLNTYQVRDIISLNILQKENNVFSQKAEHQTDCISRSYIPNRITKESNDFSNFEIKSPDVYKKERKKERRKERLRNIRSESNISISGKFVGEKELRNTDNFSSKQINQLTETDKKVEIKKKRIPPVPYRLLRFWDQEYRIKKSGLDLNIRGSKREYTSKAYGLMNIAYKKISKLKSRDSPEEYTEMLIKVFFDQATKLGWNLTLENFIFKLNRLVDVLSRNDHVYRERPERWL